MAKNATLYSGHQAFRLSCFFGIIIGFCGSLMRKLLLLLTGLLALMPTHSYAFEIPATWVGPVCKFLPCSGLGGGAGGLSNYVMLHIMPIFEFGFATVAIFLLFIAAANMVMFAEQEDVVKNSRTTFVYAIIGAGIVAFSRWIAVAFSPLETGSNLVNGSVVNALVGNVITFFKLLLAILLIVNIVIQAFRLIASRGLDDKIDTARKRLISGFFGVAFIMLANTIALTVNPEFGGSDMFNAEITGIANYLITFIGAGSVFSMIIGGILLLVSADESLKDKAKTMIKTAFVALIAVLVAYGFVTTLFSV